MKKKLLIVILFFMFGFLNVFIEKKSGIMNLGNLLKNEEIINRINEEIKPNELCTKRESGIYEEEFYINYMGKAIRFIKLKKGVIIC